jgi:ATP-dependent helicase/nuclease subunit B
MQTFQQMMEAGFTKATFSIVPPSLDQVTAADMERSRLLDIKVVYLLGVNEGVLPAALEESSMLQETDRAWLEQQGIELEESGEAKLLNENFLIYRTMSLPSDRLIVSYPMADEEGKRLQPSIVIQQLLDMFPDQAPVLIQNEPGVYSNGEQLHFVNASMKTMSFLIGELERRRQGEGIADLWWSVYNVFVKNNRMEKLTKQ